DLEALASERKLSVVVLGKFGVTAVVWDDRPALQYRTALGIDRLKFVDGKKPKYQWAQQGGEAHPYGLGEALALLLLQPDDDHILYIVNGEPSVWGCAYRDVPAICLCSGEGTVPNALVLDQLREKLSAVGFVGVRIVFDVDAAGRTGARRLAAALREAG